MCSSELGISRNINEIYGHTSATANGIIYRNKHCIVLK